MPPGFDRIAARGVNDASSDLESAVASPASSLTLWETDMKLSIGIASMLLAVSAHAGDVVRYPLPNGSKFPIASAVEVPAGRP